MPALSAAPTILTGRLELRAHRTDDLDACLNLWTDPEVLRHISPRPPTRQEVWTRLLRYAGHWALLGYGYWLAVERGSGRFMGELGLAQFKRDLLQALPAYERLPEAGWVLLPWAHGQGFASEAMTAVMAWRDEHLAEQGTFCLIKPENTASLKLAARLGFAPRTEVGEGDSATTLLLRP